MPVGTIEEVLSHALMTMPEPIISDENDQKVGKLKKYPKTAENQGEEVIRREIFSKRHKN